MQLGEDGSNLYRYPDQRLICPLDVYPNDEEQRLVPRDKTPHRRLRSLTPHDLISSI